MKFKVGDVVRLKSGGSDMTVTKTLPNDTYHVTWFDGAQKRTALFHLVTLEKVA